MKVLERQQTRQFGLPGELAEHHQLVSFNIDLKPAPSRMGRCHFEQGAERQRRNRRAELELMIQRRESRRKLAEAEVDGAIVERYYQTRAIRKIGEALEKDRERKALVVMATGAGKTRTVIAVCDLLTRCNWAKRVLFLRLGGCGARWLPRAAARGVGAAAISARGHPVRRSFRGGERGVGCEGVE